MTYSALSNMRRSASLQERLVAATAQEGITDPDQWVVTHSWEIVARTEWVARWNDAEINYNPTFNPDTGARPDVITDGHILAAIQAVNGAPA